MSTDRPLHDDKFLAELAAFDELLRKPLEPERPPTPPTSAPAPAAALRKPAAEPLRKTGERLRKPTQPARPPAPPPRFELTEPEDLVLPSREMDAALVARALQPPRRFRVSALSVAALAAGILGGGPLGWWLAVNLFVAAPPTEFVDDVPSISAPATTTARPATPRAATRRGASNAAAPNVSATNLAASSAASNAVPATGALNTAAPRAGASDPLAPMVSAPAATAGGAGIPPVPIAPEPSLDLPLPAAPPAATPLAAAPLPVAPSMSPAAPLAVAAAGALAAVAVADEAAIERALRQYKDAYERLDAKAASAVWPTVDQRALSRAFAGLASQSLDFRGCEVVMRAGASTATASCSGTAEYVRKVGDARVRVEPRQWTFTLNKTQGAWRIEAVDGSR
jgi:hypothetical protein